VQRRSKLSSSAIEATFSAWTVPRSYSEYNGRYSSVESSGMEYLSADNDSWRISIAKFRYQETSSEDTAEE
jgi:hypothetical protein